MSRLCLESSADYSESRHYALTDGLTVTESLQISQPKSEVNLTAPVFFPGLNQARAVAAFAVVICHIEQIKVWYGIRPFHSLSTLGSAGVTLFFVLSAFLITFLLLQEQGRHNRIDLKKFYLRRICRIWPLYYFIVIVSFFVLPLFWHAPTGHLAELSAALPQDFGAKLGLYVCFLPSLCSILYPRVAFASQCWTLGVEEQFYLFWPVCVILFRRHLVWASMVIIGAKSALLHSIALYSKSLQVDNQLLSFLKIVNDVVVQFDAEAFILGGLAAWLMVRRPTFVQKWLVHPLTVTATIATISYCLFVDVPFQPPLIRIAFALMIITLAHRPTKLGPLTNFVDHLGRVSYGLYMYHWAVAAFVAQWLLYLPRYRFLDNLLIYSLTIGLSIAISSLSYKYLEEPFLRIKKKLAVVQTI